jgi:hypothetical protein
MLSTTIQRTPDEIFVLIAPGKIVKVSAYSLLEESIKTVIDNPKTLVISHDGKSPTLPQAGIFNQQATQFNIMRTAAAGMPVSLKKAFMGAFKFERKTDALDFPEMNVPWLVGALAYEFQQDSAGVGLQVVSKSWL